MLDYVSANHLLYKLKAPDYIYFGNINLPWHEYVLDCEQAVIDNPNYFTHNVLGADVWQDKDSQKILGDKYTYTKAGYNEQNTRIWKTTMVDPKIDMAWEQNITNKLPVDHAIATPTLQQPGNILPIHVDTFIYMKKKLGQNSNIVRFLIMMKDWEDGHTLQVGTSWLGPWKAGDIYLWHPDRPHLAVNAGLTNKWTCNVTGVLQ